MTTTGQLAAETRDGRFVRQANAFTDRITADGSSGFKAEPGRYHLFGDQVTEADVRLFATLVRFDTVYHGHFKCNLRRLVDYPNLWGYARDLYQRPGFGDTTDFDHIKRHYYATHDRINPTRIVPKGPAVDWRSAHGRDSRD
jgi:putative glutathione S-transferase